MRTRAAALAILLLLTPLLPVPSVAPPHAAAQAALENVTYAWWHEAWHMRVPVLLEPKIVDRLNGGFQSLANDKPRNYPAAVEVDFTRAMRLADDRGFGWPQDPQGNLASFTFDPASVRVVEYDRFRGCYIARLSDGSYGCPTSALRPEDLGRALVPSTFTTGLFSNPGGADPLFHPERNAVGTVQFVVRGEFSAPRLFFVYFDILQNDPSLRPAARYRAEDSGVLDGLHWVRSGTEVYGLAPGTETGGPAVLEVTGLYDNTTVSIGQYVSRSVEPAEMVRATINALSNGQNNQAGTCPEVNYRGTVCLEVPQGDRFFFRVLANKPVIVSMRVLRLEVGPAWVPSKDGGVMGTQFLFRPLGTSAQDGNAPLYVISPNGPAQVSASGRGCGADPQEPSPASFSGTVDGIQPLRTLAGGICTITASRPVLVMGSAANNDFGMNLASFHGAPQGAHLAGLVNSDLTIVNRQERPAELLLGCRFGCVNAELENAPLPVAEPLYSFGCGCGTVAQVWRLDTHDEAPIWARAGEEGVSAMGGRDGMNFTLSLRPRTQAGGGLTSENDPRETRFVVLGVYNSTRVLVKHLNGSLPHPFNGTLSVNDWIDRGANNVPVMGYGHFRIEASKPVVVYMYGPGSSGRDPAFATFFAAKAEPPVATLGKGEFHGFAVGWEEKVKTAAVGPGERVRLRLRVLNLGRGIGGGPLPDDITLSREVSAPANATAAEVDLSSVLEAQVPSFQGRDITLSATVPADAATGTVYQVNITARSKGNPAFSDVARVVITVQIRYEFTLRFVETNSTSIQKIVRADAETCMDIEARNTGTGDVDVRLQLAPPASSDAALGFRPLLLPLVQGPCTAGGAAPLVGDDGEGTAPLTLARGQVTSFTLYVKAPGGANALPLELEIQGTAAQDASVRQALSATVFTNVEAKLRLTALNDTRFILPGGNASFDMLIENIGDVETPIEYGLTGLLPQGWNITFGEAPNLLRGRGAFDTLLGRALDRATFTVNITAAKAAPVALVVPVNVQATSAIIIDTGDTARAFRQSSGAKVTAIVANNFTLEQPETLPLTINPGEPFGLAFDLRNAANGNFTLRVLQGALPRNWTMTIDQPAGPVRLEVGDRASVRVNVTPEVATKAGAYELGLALVTEDAFTQGAQFRNLTVLVRSTVEFRVVPEIDELVLPPGGQREIGLRVVNTGNLPVQLRLTAAAPPGYQASLPQGTRLDLAPGEDAARSVLLRAPAQSAEAPAALRLVGLDDTSNKQKEFPITVRTARLDLVLADLVLVTEDPQVGQPALVAATVQNQGSVPANNLALALLVNGRGVRNETVRTLPPGEPRVVTIPWTVDEEPRTITVIVDADEKYAEGDESNNARTLDRSQGLPGFEAPALALALAAAVALARTRARLKPPSRGAEPDG